MTESKSLIIKTFIPLLLLTAGFIGGIALFPSTEGPGKWIVSFLGIGFVAGAHLFAMRRMFALLEKRIKKTHRVLEETYSKELQEYTEKLERETHKLQETTDFLHSILDSSTEYSIITTGKDGKITLLNKGAERLIGYTSDEVVNKESPLLFLRGSAGKSFAQIGIQIMKYGVDEGEWEIIRKDGQVRTMIFTMTPMKNRDGHMLGFLGIAKDITEQKKLERQLQDYTENLEIIVEKRTEELARKNVELDAERRTAEHRAQELDMINKLSQAISSTIDLEKVLAIGAERVVELLHVSQARIFLIKEGTERLEALYKYEKATHHGELIYVTAPLSRYPDFLRAINMRQPVVIDDVQNSGMAPEVKRVFQKQDIPSLMNLPLISKDSAIGIMMLLHTGEQRHFSEEEIRLAETVSSQLMVALKNAQLFRRVMEEKGRIEALVNSSADGILMTDNKFHLVLTNAVIEQLFQININASHGKHLIEFVDTQKEKFKDFELVKEVFYQIITSPQHTIVQEIGMAFPTKTLKIIGNPVLGEEQEVIGHMIALHDITQEKQLEQMREDFISMIVHDLKNPLAGVIGFSEIMLSKAKKRGIEDFTRFLTGILDQANTMHDMVNNILEIHKMEDGSMEIQKELAEFEEIIDTAIRQIEVSAKQKEITIKRDIPQDFPAIFVDQTKMIRLFANILSNGIKYTPDDGNITIHVKIQENTILTGISDTGKGIPVEYLETIFDRFAQVDRKRQGKAASVGLGLYFCKLVVEAHGGRIWAESGIEQGSTFYFTIPHLMAETHETSVAPVMSASRNNVS